MAHKRKDVLVASKEWWVHLRPFNKRLQAKAERRAAGREIEGEMEPDETPKGLGLHNDPRMMAKLRKEKGDGVVPWGGYCYGAGGTCPFLDVAENKPKQGNGYCWLLCKGDWDVDMDLLWDACKACGINDVDAPEGTLSVVGEED